MPHTPASLEPRSTPIWTPGHHMRPPNRPRVTSTPAPFSTHLNSSGDPAVTGWQEGANPGCGARPHTYLRHCRAQQPEGGPRPVPSSGQTGKGAYLRGHVCTCVGAHAQSWKGSTRQHSSTACPSCSQSGQLPANLTDLESMAVEDLPNHDGPDFTPHWSWLGSLQGTSHPDRVVKPTSHLTVYTGSHHLCCPASVSGAPLPTPGAGPGIWSLLRQTSWT